MTLYGIVDEQKMNKNLHITELIHNFEHLKSHNMKHILTIIFLIVTIAACQRHSNVYDCLVNADSLIDKNKDSAAIRQLLTINKSDLKTDEERAYYGLLHDMATYRLRIPVESDSGITYSVAYYRKTANKYNLARALYYKGMISFRNNNINVALTCLKEAEHLAVKVMMQNY